MRRWSGKEPELLSHFRFREYVMEKHFPPQNPISPAQDRRAEVLARIESALRSTVELGLLDEKGGLDPYNTLNGPIRRDVWGARAR